MAGRGIVLIERKNPPYGWALPGGFVDYGESLERRRSGGQGRDFLDIELLISYTPIRIPAATLASTRSLRSISPEPGDGRGPRTMPRTSGSSW